MSISAPARALPAAPVFAQPQASVATSVAAIASRAARYRTRVALGVGAGPGNVQHDLELEQRSARGDGVGSLPCVCLDGGAARPGLECLVGFPLHHDEVAVFALDRPEQLE